MKRPIYGRFQHFETIPALCRHIYFVVITFQKPQYLVVIIYLFHLFQGDFREEVGFLLAYFSVSKSNFDIVFYNVFPCILFCQDFYSIVNPLDKFLACSFIWTPHILELAFVVYEKCII